VLVKRRNFRGPRNIIENDGPVDRSSRNDVAVCPVRPCHFRCGQELSPPRCVGSRVGCIDSGAEVDIVGDPTVGNVNCFQDFLARKDSVCLLLIDVKGRYGNDCAMSGRLRGEGPAARHII
jgi:hypothetical protein